MMMTKLCTSASYVLANKHSPPGVVRSYASVAVFVRYKLLRFGAYRSRIFLGPIKCDIIKGMEDYWPNGNA